MTQPISVTVATGVAISAKSTSKTPGDHVAVFNLAENGGTNNAGLKRGVGQYRIQRVRSDRPRDRSWHAQDLACQSRPRPNVRCERRGNKR